VDSIENLCQKVREIDALALQQIAAEIFDAGKQSVLIYK